MDHHDACHVSGSSVAVPRGCLRPWSVRAAHPDGRFRSESYPSDLVKGSELSSYLPDFAVFTHIDLKPLSGPAALLNWTDVLTQPSSLTRLTWQDLDDVTAHGVITWEGSRGVLLEDITVSNYAPRLPRQAFSVVRLYFE